MVGTCYPIFTWVKFYKKITPHFLTSKMLLFFEFLSTGEGEEERGEEGEDWKRKEKEEEEEELI